MNDRFQGVPKLILTADGSTIQYQGGQPVMDQGLENVAMISLFTAPGWWGNSLVQNQDQEIGSNFEAETKKPITLQMLTDVQTAAENALDDPSFGKVNTTVLNPEYDRLEITNLIEPPGQDTQEIILTRNGQNWINQAVDPAYKRVNS